MKLSDVATIKTNFSDADFWIIRRGSLKTVGEPSYTFNPESIGIKVTRPDVVLSSYLYYCFLHLHQSKVWEPVATVFMVIMLAGFIAFLLKMLNLY